LFRPAPPSNTSRTSSGLLRPAALHAGIGDTVIDLKLTQSLPNAFGKADIFGRTRDAGRVIVRLVGLDGNQATFVARTWSSRVMNRP